MLSTICAAEVELPKTAAGHQASAWLQVFNSGDREKLRDFMQNNLPDRDQHMHQEMGLRTMTGGFDWEKLTSLRSQRSSPWFRNATLTDYLTGTSEPRSRSGNDSRIPSGTDDIFRPSFRHTASKFGRCRTTSGCTATALRSSIPQAAGSTAIGLVVLGAILEKSPARITTIMFASTARGDDLRRFPPKKKAFPSAVSDIRSTHENLGRGIARQSSPFELSNREAGN
jgi:hypothetical protein